MTLYLHQIERTAPHTQSGHCLPEIKLRLSKLSWVTLKLSPGRLKSSTARVLSRTKPSSSLYLVFWRTIRYCFNSYILPPVRHDVTHLPAPSFEKCDQLSHLFPETKCENKTLTSSPKFFTLWQEPRSNIRCIGHPSLFIRVMHYRYSSTLVKISGIRFSAIKFRSSELLRLAMFPNNDTSSCSQENKTLESCITQTSTIRWVQNPQPVAGWESYMT